MTHPDPTDLPQVFTHGGARSNAGRKASDKPAMKARTLRFTPDALKRLETLKKSLRLSWPKLIERLVEAEKAVWTMASGHDPVCACVACECLRGGKP